MNHTALRGGTEAQSDATWCWELLGDTLRARGGWWRVQPCPIRHLPYAPKQRQDNFERLCARGREGQKGAMVKTNETSSTRKQNETICFPHTNATDTFFKTSLGIVWIRGKGSDSYCRSFDGTMFCLGVLAALANQKTLRNNLPPWSFHRCSKALFHKAGWTNQFNSELLPNVSNFSEYIWISLLCPNEWRGNL